LRQRVVAVERGHRGGKFGHIDSAVGEREERIIAGGTGG
jgi:hypothetical protein